MTQPQTLDEFIHQAASQGQRRIRIAIVGDPASKPWVVRCEAYNKLHFDITSEDDDVFSHLQSRLNSAGFEATVIGRQPYEGKLDPKILEAFVTQRPAGVKRNRRKGQ